MPFIDKLNAYITAGFVRHKDDYASALGIYGDSKRSPDERSDIRGYFTRGPASRYMLSNTCERVTFYWTLNIDVIMDRRCVAWLVVCESTARDSFGRR